MFSVKYAADILFESVDIVCKCIRIILKEYNVTPHWIYRYCQS